MSISLSKPDEVHALLGETAPGKSTLIKVMTGAIRSDGGVIHLDGEPLRPESAGRGAQPQDFLRLSGSQSRSRRCR